MRPVEAKLSAQFDVKVQGHLLDIMPCSLHGAIAVVEQLNGQVHVVKADAIRFLDREPEEAYPLP